ncbi:MAG: hypothetical protein PHX82_01020 [Paracoccaceae bacterium]|nr:hypothetical protein [Paracoccaceae bacterium]
MIQDVTWTKAGQIFAAARPVGALFPLESAMDEIGRAARDLAFCEAAEVIADNRIMVLREMITACKAEIYLQDDAVAAELQAAVEGLGEELESFEETRPLEAAFRADQRDQACARISAAQTRLRSFVANPLQEAELFDPALSREEAVELARAALARSPEDIVLSARAEARARVAGAPIPVPGGENYHFTQPEGWTAWLATRLAARTGLAMRG